MAYATATIALGMGVYWAAHNGLRRQFDDRIASEMSMLEGEYRREGPREIHEAVADVKAALDCPGALTPGVRYEPGALCQQQQIAFLGLAKVFLAALVAEFVLLLLLYRRFAMPALVRWTERRVETA